MPHLLTMAAPQMSRWLSCGWCWLLMHFGITEKPTRDCILLCNNVGFRVGNFEVNVLVSSAKQFFSARVCFGCSRLSKVIVFGMKQKCVYDFLLCCHSNLGPILHHFRDIAGFLCSWPHLYSTLILGVFLLDHITKVGVNVSRYLKLFGREIIFEVFQPMWSWYLNMTDGWTYSHITALCVASRGKNCMCSVNAAAHYCMTSNVMTRKPREEGGQIIWNL